MITGLRLYHSSRYIKILTLAAGAELNTILGKAPDLLTVNAVVTTLLSLTFI